MNPHPYAKIVFAGIHHQELLDEAARMRLLRGAGANGPTLSMAVVTVHRYLGATLGRARQRLERTWWAPAPPRRGPLPS